MYEKKRLFLSTYFWGNEGAFYHTGKKTRTKKKRKIT